MAEASDSITIIYDSTLGERREGLALMQAPVPRKLRAVGRRQTVIARGWLGWLMFVGAAILLFIYLKQSDLGRNVTSGHNEIVCFAEATARR